MSGRVSTLLAQRLFNARSSKRLWMASAIGLMLPGSAWAQTDSQPATAQAPASASSPTEREVIVVEGTRILSPGLSPTGANEYSITAKNIDDLPAGINTVLTDVIAQMPGVGIVPDYEERIKIMREEGRVDRGVFLQKVFFPVLKYLEVTRQELQDAAFTRRSTAAE